MGLELVKPTVNINFVRLRKWALGVSGLLILLGMLSLVIKGGPRYGIDFAGGTVIQVKFGKSVTADEVRTAVKEIGLKNAIIQRFGSADNHEYLVRTKTTTGALQRTSELLKGTLEKELGEGMVEIRRVEMVGPKVGKDLREKALLALFYAILAIGIYISGRFEMKWGTSAIMAAILLGIVYICSLLKVPPSFLVILAFMATLMLYVILRLRFALGAVLAIIHDMFITIGVFSLLNKEADLLIIAALLMIMGYSLNDTIVVFDRIRENMRKSSKKGLAALVNSSINKTLSRTILTSGTTILILLALYILGGSVIHDFAFALLVGITVGTYSSIFIASPVLTVFEGKHFFPKIYKQQKVR
jgi:preprotein translocase subunit SecF